MSQTKSFILIVSLLASVILISSSAFILPEGRQAIITRFGKPIGDSVTNAGLHFKKPFVEDVRYVDKRILIWDGNPNQIPTKDKKYIMVDTTARWRIIDALKFIETVQDERGAKDRLDGILEAITRDTISNHNLVETVRNSNTILNEAKEKKEKRKALLAAGTVVLEEEEVIGEIEAVGVGREKLSAIITEKADKELAQFGISIIDVQLRRISYEASVEQKVYDRMISERMRIAEKIRSIGKGEQAKIHGKISRDLQKIESQAYRTAQIIKGKAEAKATGIYARAYSKNPNFYAFLKKMEVYKNSLQGETEFITTTNSDFLNMLKKSN